MFHRISEPVRKDEASPTNGIKCRAQTTNLLHLKASGKNDAGIAIYTAEKDICKRSAGGLPRAAKLRKYEKIKAKEKIIRKCTRQTTAQLCQLAFRAPTLK